MRGVTFLRAEPAVDKSEPKREELERLIKVTLQILMRFSCFKTIPKGELVPFD